LHYLDSTNIVHAVVNDSNKKKDKEHSDKKAKKAKKRKRRHDDMDEVNTTIICILLMVFLSGLQGLNIATSSQRHVTALNVETTNNQAIKGIFVCIFSK
jgi:hypothetical protein